MATRRITTRLALDGEKQFKDELAAVNRELRNLSSEMKLSEAQFKGQANSIDALTEKGKILQKEYDQQKEKAEALADRLKMLEEKKLGTTKAADDYRASLNRAKAAMIELEGELKNNAKYLDEARKSADKTADSIDEFGREAKEAGDGVQELSLDNLISSVGNLKGLLAGGAVGLGIGAIKEVAGAVMDLEESTREWRSIMGGLEVSSRQAGYTAEETAESYDYLYGVLGDAQTTTTTLANLQAVGLAQEDLMTLIDMTTGAWNKYGDSIPIDGLAESINETIRAGQITGTFADVINWGSEELNTFGVALKEDTEANKEWNEAVMDAKTSEDYFNLALQEASTEAERADLVMRAMAEQGLAEAGQAYRDVNEDIIAANDSQNELDKAWGTLGETVAPIADFFRETLAGALGTVNDVVQGGIDLVGDLRDIFSDLIDRVNDWIDSWDFSGFYDFIDRTNDWLGNNQFANKPVGWENQVMGGRFDGSYAVGLDRVPFDGFRPILHKDEAILTAEEADFWRSLKGASAAQPAGVTAADLQGVTAAAVNGLSTALGGGNGVKTVVLKLNINGKEFYTETIDDLRAVERSMPEVTSDR